VRSQDAVVPDGEIPGGVANDFSPAIGKLAGDTVAQYLEVFRFHIHLLCDTCDAGRGLLSASVNQNALDIRAGLLLSVFRDEVDLGWSIEAEAELLQAVVALLPS